MPLSSLPQSVTCKIRLLERFEDTLRFVRALESTGVSAIGIHGRLRDQVRVLIVMAICFMSRAQRPREPVTEEQCEQIRCIAATVNIPIIANGGSLDIACFDDIEAFRVRCVVNHEAVMCHVLHRPRQVRRRSWSLVPRSGTCPCSGEKARCQSVTSSPST